MHGKARKILSLVLSFGLLFQQLSFAQVAFDLRIADHLSMMRSSLITEKFRPPQLRYFSYDHLNDNFKVLLDKGDFTGGQSPSRTVPEKSRQMRGLSPKVTVPDEALKQETKTLLNYFLIGIALQDSAFWVNLRPDSEDQIIDPALGRTDIGKILLEADLQLKKDTSSFTSPQTAEGREYWDKLYKKAEELYGNENITIPTLTRPWIVPGEIIVRESKESAYVYKANLKVMLEQDYLKDSTQYSFKDERSKALNEYSSQLIRELIIPKLTREVNSSKRYAPLRQVYYSLVLSRWFKLRFRGQSGSYPSLIDTNNISNLTSQQTWSKTDYFQQYKKSFAQGEYNVKEPVSTPTGQMIRSYFSGGIDVSAGKIASSSFTFKNDIPRVLANQGMIIGGPAAVDSELTQQASSAITEEEKPAQKADKAGSPVTDSDRALTFNNDPVKRLGQVKFLLDEINKELKNLGSSELPSIFIFGDLHGAAEQFSVNLAKMFEIMVGYKGQIRVGMSLREQLSNNEAEALKNIKHIVLFTGDIPHRGPLTIQSYWWLKELDELFPAGHVFKITGNHDKYEADNFQGRHLPWYKDYNFYGDKKAEEIILEQRKNHPEYFDGEEGKLWWAARLAEYNAAQEKLQYRAEYYNEKKQKELGHILLEEGEGLILSGRVHEIRKEFISLYEKFQGKWNEEQLSVMERFIGYFARIQVLDPFVGLNGIGKTSVAWWEEAVDKLEAGHDARKLDGGSAEELAAWEKAAGYSREILKVVREHLQEEMSKEYGWTARIFESINNQAYRSLEWNAKDSSSHKGWGPEVIKELNRMLKDPKYNNAQLKRDREKSFAKELANNDVEPVTQANYLRSKVLEDMANYYRRNFNLYVRTPYNDLISHSLFPINKERRTVVIHYRGREYAGEEIFAALDAIAADIRDPNKSFSDNWEASNIVNEWYADFTTTVKGPDEDDYVEMLAEVNEGLGIGDWAYGHNIIHKTKRSSIVTRLDKDGHVRHSIKVDYALSPGLDPSKTGWGGFFYIGPLGQKMYALNRATGEIVESPDTIIPGKKGSSDTVINNHGISGRGFLMIKKALLEEERKALEAQLGIDGSPLNDKQAVESGLVQVNSRVSLTETEKIFNQLADRVSGILEYIKEPEDKVGDFIAADNVNKTTLKEAVFELKETLLPVSEVSLLLYRMGGDYQKKAKYTYSSDADLLLLLTRAQTLYNFLADKENDLGFALRNDFGKATHEKSLAMAGLASMVNSLKRELLDELKNHAAESSDIRSKLTRVPDVAKLLYPGLKQYKGVTAGSPIQLVDGAEIITITNKNIKPKFWETAGNRGDQTDADDFSIDNVSRQTAGFAEEVLERMAKGEYKPINGATVRAAFAFDSRQHSDEYAEAMAKVLAAYKGFEVDIIDEAIPTPIAARLTQNDRPGAYDFVFHVTPSHNQLQYGGIKLLTVGSVNEHMWTYFFEKRANAKMEYPINNRVQLKRVRVVDQLIEEYLKEVFPGLTEKFASFKQLNPDAQFVVDFMDGSMASFAHLFQRLGMTVVRSGRMKDIDYSGRSYVLADGKRVGFAPDPTQSAFYKDEPEFQTFLQKAPNGSVYFIIDGDGDRLVTNVKLDGKLNTIKPNQFGPLAADYILTHKLLPGVNQIVRTYVTSAGMDAVARYHKLGDPVIVPVGSKYFNRFVPNVIALEESGHFVAGSFFDDTIFQLGLILQMMSETSKDVFTLLAETQQRTGFKGVDKRDDFENLSADVKQRFIEPLTGTPEEVRVKSKKAVDAIVALSGKELLEALVVVEGENGVGRVVKLEEYIHSLFTDNPLMIEGSNRGIIIRFTDLSWGGDRLSGTGNTGRLYAEGRESPEERQKIANAFINVLDLPKASSALVAESEDADTTTAGSAISSETGIIKESARLNIDSYGTSAMGAYFLVSYKKDGRQIEVPKPINDLAKKEFKRVVGNYGNNGFAFLGGVDVTPDGQNLYLSLKYNDLDSATRVGYEIIDELNAQLRKPASSSIDKPDAISGIDPSTSLRVPSIGEEVGGIDFRALPMSIQPMGSFTGLNFQLPQLSPADLARIDINTELIQIENMVKSGISPSGSRIKELVAACVQKGQISQYADSLLLDLIEICKMEEENAYESSPELREALVIVDSAQQG